ncbi:hypothetical protein PR048_025175 [Dryococelus australis]|uniref:Uncharacterized protein n=1 Tax=Dryococelus australis TaxID=614101 RepID=A0ABQ9GQP9_9NEOP|nr:hypothetical protein PR048_025175 [Dryococelus australis]
MRSEAGLRAVSLDRRMNKGVKPMAMLILHKVYEHTTCLQVDLKQGFQKCSVYREQPIHIDTDSEIHNCKRQLNGVTVRQDVGSPFAYKLFTCIHFIILKGAAVAQLLAYSPPTKAIRARSPAGLLPDPRMWESCCTKPLAIGFSRATPASPALALQRRSIPGSHFMSSSGMTGTYVSQLESSSLGGCCLALESDNFTVNSLYQCLVAYSQHAVANQTHGLLLETRVANQTHGLLLETRVANQGMSTPASKERRRQFYNDNAFVLSFVSDWKWYEPPICELASLSGIDEMAIMLTFVRVSDALSLLELVDDFLMLQKKVTCGQNCKLRDSQTSDRPNGLLIRKLFYHSMPLPMCLLAEHERRLNNQGHKNQGRVENGGMLRNVALRTKIATLSTLQYILFVRAGN